MFYSDLRGIARSSRGASGGAAAAAAQGPEFSLIWPSEDTAVLAFFS